MAKKKKNRSQRTAPVPQSGSETIGPGSADSAIIQKFAEAMEKSASDSDRDLPADSDKDNPADAEIPSSADTDSAPQADTEAPKASVMTEPSDDAAEKNAAMPEAADVPAAEEDAALPAHTESDMTGTGYQTHTSGDGPLTEVPLTEEEKAAQRRDNAEFSFLDEGKDNPYKNVFIESLENVTPDDLGKPPKKKKKDPIDMIIELFRKMIFWVAVVVFFVSGYQVVYKLYAYRQAEEIYNFDPLSALENRREDLVAAAVRDTRLQTMAPVNSTREESAELNDTADSNVYNETFEMMKGQLLILRNKNPEVIGWIRIEGDTDVNYPLVQHADNDYYLHYAYDGTYNPAGSIYLDYKNNKTLSSNRHSVIYGHNMESGSPMFANLLHYREKGYLENNRYIEIYTDDALYTYEIFAAYETNPSQTITENHSWRMNFNKDDATFLAWIDSIRARSDISPDVSIDADSRILTLSTCMNYNENRYVVHAVLVEVVK
ncbi:MAG: sortase domain-bontaining protein [Eubacteriales bacterium]